MATDADEATGALELGHLGGEFRKLILILAEPSWPPFGSLVEDAMRNEVIQIGVVMHFAVFKPEILAEGAAIIHDDRRSLCDASVRQHLDHIVVKGRDRQGVFVAVETVDQVS